MVFAFLKEAPENCSILDSHGEYNGYVGWTPDEGNLPLSNQSYWKHEFSYDDEEVLDNLVEVHGGITFDEIFDEELIELFSSREDLTELPNDMLKCRVIGFDTCHFGDGPHLDYNWCKNETLDLMKQIKKLIKKYSNDRIRN